MNPRHIAALSLWSAVACLWWPTVRSAVAFGWNDDRNVQVLAAPLIFAFFVYRERQRIFEEVRWEAAPGLALLSLALVMNFVLPPSSPVSAPGDGFDSAASLRMLSAVVAWIGAFAFCYGRRSLRAAWFPLLCLLMMVPLPAWVMDKVSTGLQRQSAAASHAILVLADVPVFADEFRLSLPGLEIEVAPECSGIRSFLGLALVALVAGRVWLQRDRSRLALVLSAIPISICKNALRISVVAWLGAFVDRAYLYGPLHRAGGLILTPLGLLLLAGVLAGLRWFEARFFRPAKAASAEGRVAEPAVVSTPND